MEIQTLQQDIEVQERQIENLEQFIQRAHKYKDLDELTPYALRELVKGVYIEAPNCNRFPPDTENKFVRYPRRYQREDN